MLCLANPPALARLFLLSACFSRNPTPQLWTWGKSKWHEDLLLFLCRAFIWEFNLFLIPLPFLCYRLMKLRPPFIFLCFFCTLYLMCKGLKESIFPISLTFVSFLGNSRSCCLWNSDCQIKFCIESEHINFIFKYIQNCILSWIDERKKIKMLFPYMTEVITAFEN